MQTAPVRPVCFKLNPFFSMTQPVENISVANGVLIIIPHNERNHVGGIELPLADKAMPCGTVIATGTMPHHLRLYRKIKLGNVVHYSRATAKDVPLLVDGKEFRCAFIDANNVQAWSAGADGPYSDLFKKNEKSFFSRAKAWVYAVGGLFSAGFIAGVLLAPFINITSSIKYFIKSKFGQGKKLG